MHLALFVPTSENDIINDTQGYTAPILKLNKTLENSQTFLGGKNRTYEIFHSCLYTLFLAALDFDQLGHVD